MATDPEPARRCTICGGQVGRRGRLTADGRAWCRGHADLVALDALPPDPLTSLPMQAGDLTYAEAVAAARERGHS